MIHSLMDLTLHRSHARRGNAVCDALASRNAGALQYEFPRRSVGTIEIFFRGSAYRRQNLPRSIALMIWKKP